MSSQLKYGLDLMQLTKDDAQKYTTAYSEAITHLDKAINALSNDWVSTEIGTYQEFLSAYNAKKHKLFEARDYMLRFCAKLDEKIQDFQDTGNSIKQSFN